MSGIGDIEQTSENLVERLEAENERLRAENARLRRNVSTLHDATIVLRNSILEAVRLIEQLEVT